MLGLSRENTIGGFGVSVCVNTHLITKINPRALSTNSRELQVPQILLLCSCRTIARGCFHIPVSHWGGGCFPLGHLPSPGIIWRIQMLLMCDFQLSQSQVMGNRSKTVSRAPVVPPGASLNTKTRIWGLNQDFPSLSWGGKGPQLWL